MSEHSAIEWTDATWNVVTGCTKVSPGCANCYIERTPAFRIAGRKFVKGATDLRMHEDRLEQPLHWKKPRRVFVNSLSDLFHPDVPDEFIVQVFAVMALCPQHTFQVLTKRPERMRALLSDDGFRGNVAEFITVILEDCDLPPSLRWDPLARRTDDARATCPDVEGEDWPLPNVWLGVSVENQRWLERVDVLKDIPAAMHFLSLEPLLEDLGALILDGIEWVIVGGESGPDARPCRLSWIRSVVRECQRQYVPCFVKQIGARPLIESKHDSPLPDVVCVATRTDRKGGNPAEWPADLRVREFPL